MKKKAITIKFLPSNKPNASVLKTARQFLLKFKTIEHDLGSILVLYYDEKSKAFYVTSHIPSASLVKNSDLEAVLDSSENEEFKLNRDLYTDNYAYKCMERDALEGRSFEDIVMEYDTSYRKEKPLKVFGGQHRIQAIKEAVAKGIHTNHGIRVYFELTTEQRLDIATANNTSIAVANDLLDRMQEDFLGPNLRQWCQGVSLLDKDENFADRRDPQGAVTVRIARTLVVNFFKGQQGAASAYHTPVVCSSGPKLDLAYEQLRKTINWSGKDLKSMGEQFAKLHKTQRERVLNRTADKYTEFANKCIHPCVAASWAYTAGLLQHNPSGLKAHYGLVDAVKAPSDPLNAKALSTARYLLIDPETYRGLGTRMSGSELGRMSEVFVMQATEASKRGITAKLANAAIKAFEAKKASMIADKAKKGI